MSKSVWRTSSAGFTLVELVVVIVVVGILAITAMPRFANKADFDARGFFDGTLSILRYAQKSAVAQRRMVCVVFGADSSVTLTIAANFGGACDTPLAGPNGAAPYALAAPSGVGFAAVPTSFNFGPSGEASLGQNISVVNLPGRSITVVASTGYVQEN
ncbi:MAG: prepilin-type N-terminal cleavage/methylation domain-containing protein [Propionivibrio sp.]